MVRLMFCLTGSGHSKFYQLQMSSEEFAENVTSIDFLGSSVKLGKLLV